jgi:predicted aspartyl protease
MQNDLSPPAYPVVTANGGEMALLGLTEVKLTVGTLVVNHPVLVASDLAQSCLLGADFLKKYGCIINLQAGTLTADKIY